MKTKIKVFTMLMVAFALVLSHSCKKDDTEENDDPNDPVITDNLDPQIGVTSPTADFSFLSAGEVVTIGGFANDNVEVTKVLWSSSDGQSGVATGTTNWEVQDVQLSNGDNLFTFIAYDAAENNSSTTLNVTYNEFFDFSGSLTINPDGMYINVSTDVYFHIPILDNPNLIDNSVILIEVDQQGNMLEEYGEMFDDGDLAHGDDIQGDGVYSLMLAFIETVPVQKFLRVRVSTDEASGQVNSYSEIGSIQAVDQIPDEAVQEILAAQQEAYNEFETALVSVGIDEAVLQTIEFLNGSSAVTEAGQTGSGDIWIEFGYGLSGMILATEDGDEGGSASQGGKRATTATVPVHKQTRGVNSQTMYQVKEDEDIVLDKDVMLFAPNWVQFNSWGTEFLDNVNTIYTDSECPNFNVAYLKNEQADLAALRTLGEYGTIVIHTHGGLDKDDNVIFLTGDEVDISFDEIFEWIMGRVMPIPHQGKDIWAVKPSFITAYNQSYPNTIVYNGSCESYRNNTMANAFITKGANAYFGFSQTVRSWFDRDMANQLFPKLVTESKSITEAFVANQHDDHVPPAYFVVSGNMDTRYTSGFVNGDYEEANLSGWNVVGDGRVITQLGFISPYAGSFMGVISTGLGFTTEMGSMSQDFCVPEDVTTLSLNWNFMSEEFLEYVGSGYQDYFQIMLIDENDNQNILFLKTIDIIHAEYPLTLISPDIVFDQGDVYGTGWQFSSFDISAFAGTAVTIVLSAGDVGDSIFDTVILLDEITVE